MNEKLWQIKHKSETPPTKKRKRTKEKKTAKLNCRKERKIKKYMQMQNYLLPGLRTG